MRAAVTKLTSTRTTTIAEIGFEMPLSQTVTTN